MSNIKFFSFIILSFTLFLAVDCEGPEVCTKEYKFEFPVTITPVLDTFQVGDTIWVNLEFDNSNILDLNSGNFLDLQDFEFQFEMIFEKFDTIGPVNAFDYFNHQALIGDIFIQNIESFNELIMILDKTDSERKISYFLIPQQVGNYVMAFTSILNGDEVTLQNQNCTETIKLSFSTNGNVENNFDFYKTNSTNTKITLEEFQESGAFAFKVLE